MDKKLLLYGGIGVGVIVLLAVILALSLGGGSDPYVGVWSGVKLEAEGIALNVGEVMGGIAFDIKKDGTCVAVAGGESFTGTWEKTKGGIIIKAAGLTIDCKADGKALIAENYGGTGMTLTLERAGGKNASSDPNVGVWLVASAEMWGLETDIGDIFANGFSIELLDKGKCKLNIDGTKGDGKWTLKDGVLTIKGGGLDTGGTLKDGLLVLEDVMGIGLKLSFRKEGDMSFTTPSAGGDPFLPDEDDAAAGFVSPTTSIELGSYWYGVAYISNFKPEDKAASVNGPHDVWGYIDAGSDERAYFELYDAPEMEGEPLLSLYIDLYDTYFYADIGHEDAWLLGLYLDESAAYDFSPMLDNGALRIDYHREGKSGSYDVTILVREDGAPWDEENDILPENYEAYKAEHGFTGGGGSYEADTPAVENLPAAKLRAAYDAMDPSGMTYEEVRDLYLDGVDGEREERDNPDIHAYVWRAEEGPEKCMYVSFKKNAAGKYVYTSRSISNIPS